MRDCLGIQDLPYGIILIQLGFRVFTNYKFRAYSKDQIDEKEIGWRFPTYTREGCKLVRERLVSSNCVSYNLVRELYT